MYRRSLIQSLGSAVALGSVGRAGRADAVGGHSSDSTTSSSPPDSGSLSVVSTPDGYFFVDEHGRTVILHGVNVGNKIPPYIPTDDAFGESDVERIRSWGFNVVRLGVFWAGISPERGRIDRDYLARVRELVELFDDHGIHVVVNMHQNLYSHVFDGAGAPEWAVYTDGFPFLKSTPWQLDYADPAVTRAFDNFWLGNHGLQAAYSDAVRALARSIHHIDGLIGYGLFNEPSPGLFTFPWFEDVVLPQFYGRIAAAIRAVDSTTPIWVEPEALTSIGKPAALRDVPVDQLVYSFHNYADRIPDSVNPWGGDLTDPVGDWLQRWVCADNRRRATALEAVPVLSEFCPGNDIEDTAHVVDLADAYRTGWIYWAYRDWGTRTSGRAGTMVNHPDVVETLVRPYPPAIAGVPRAFGFDRESRTFTLSYRPWARASRPTVLFVPAAVYPDGYAIDVEGGHASRHSGEYLWVRHRPGATTVEVTLTPAR